MLGLWSGTNNNLTIRPSCNAY